MNKRIRAVFVPSVVGAVAAAVVFLAAPMAQAAAPGNIHGIRLFDEDGNGQIDTVRVLVNNGGGATWTVNGTPGFTASAGGQNIDITGVVIETAPTDLTTIVAVSLSQADADLPFNTSSAALELAYAQSNAGSNTCTNCVKANGVVQMDAIASGDGGNAQESDYANPVILSVSPASGVGGVGRSEDIEIVFSEAMVEAFDYGTHFTTNIDPGGWSDDWTVGLETVTLSHNPFSARTVTITLDENEIDAYAGEAADYLPLLLTGPQDGSWTFVTAGGSNNASGNLVPQTVLPEVACTVSAPAAGASAEHGRPMDITWTSVGERIANARVQYSLDNGTSWSDIIANAPNTGSYTWNVTAPVGTQLIIRVICQENGGGTVASGVSGAVSVVAPVSVDAPTASDDVSVPKSSSLPAGTLIKAQGLSAVYYVDTDGTRRPFINERIFKTWFADFNAVVEVPLADIAQYEMGRPMLPKPGSLLIKVQSAPKTYWIDPADGKAHWLASESAARRVAGAAWNTLVIDIDASIFSSIIFGADIK